MIGEKIQHIYYYASNECGSQTLLLLGCTTISSKILLSDLCLGQRQSGIVCLRG